jgi:hypothetical protein
MSGSQPLCVRRSLRLLSLLAPKHRWPTPLVGPAPRAPPAIVLARTVRPVAAASVETRARAQNVTEARLGKLGTARRCQQALGFGVPLLAAAKWSAPRRHCDRGE